MRQAKRYRQRDRFKNICTPCYNILRAGELISRKYVMGVNLFYHISGLTSQNGMVAEGGTRCVFIFELAIRQMPTFKRTSEQAGS